MLGLAGALRAAEIHHDALADLQESERIVGARVAGGVAPKYDATRIGLAVAAAEGGVPRGRGGRVEARGQLDVAVGPLAERLRGPPRVDVFAGAEVPPLATLQARMLEGRPDLAAAGERLEAARAGDPRGPPRGVPRHRPAGRGRLRSGPGQVDVGAGLTVPLPILSRGQGFIDRARAEARSEQRGREGPGRRRRAAPPRRARGHPPAQRRVPAPRGDEPRRRGGAAAPGAGGLSRMAASARSSWQTPASASARCTSATSSSRRRPPRGARGAPRGRGRRGRVTIEMPDGPVLPGMSRETVEYCPTGAFSGIAQA